MSSRSSARRAAAGMAFVVVCAASACGGSAAREVAAPPSMPATTAATVAPVVAVGGSQPAGTSPPVVAERAPTTAPDTTTAGPPTTASARPPAPAPRPVPTAAPPTTVAHADDFSFEECGKDSVADPAAVANSVGVPGPPVALIADSIGSQVRFGLIAGLQHHWVVWSRCGASVDDALAAGAAGAVGRFRPTVVVVALGTNDAGYPNPVPGSAQGFAASAAKLVDQIGPGPCVVWIDVAQRGDPVLQTEMNTVNTGITALFLRGVRVGRWTDVVKTDPGVLVDRVHLSHHGVERRIALLDAAVDSCSGPKR